MISPIDDKNYLEFINKHSDVINVLLLVGKDCNPCHSTLKMLESKLSSNEVENFNGIRTTFGACIVDNSPKISEKYSIRSVPFIVFVKSNKEVSSTKMGFQNIDVFMKEVELAAKGDDSVLFKDVEKDEENHIEEIENTKDNFGPRRGPFAFIGNFFLGSR